MELVACFWLLVTGCWLLLPIDQPNGFAAPCL
jgi:hypothetical protein